jgi:hypothetical protein
MLRRRSSAPSIFSLARGGVHQPLDDVDRLRPPGTAVGAGGRGVGHHRGEVQRDRRDVVDAGRHPRPDEQLDDHAHRHRVAADVGIGARAQREHLAVGVERELGLGDQVTAMRRGAEFLQPLRAPLHRPAQRARRVRNDDVFRVQAGLHAEAAADIADAHAHLLLDQAGQRGGDAVAHRRGHLAGQRDGEPPAGRVGLGEHDTRLHRGRRQALVDDVQRHHVRRALERRIGRGGVAVLHFRGDVVRRLLAQHRRAGADGLQRVGDRGQVLEVDHHRLGAVHRRLAGFGDHRATASPT